MSKLLWTIESEANKEYNKTYFFRCVGLEKFLDKVESKGKIVCIEVNDNNIGFVTDEEPDF